MPLYSLRLAVTEAKFSVIARLILLLLVGTVVACSGTQRSDFHRFVYEPNPNRFVKDDLLLQIEGVVYTPAYEAKRVGRGFDVRGIQQSNEIFMVGSIVNTGQSDLRLNTHASLPNGGSLVGLELRDQTLTGNLSMGGPGEYHASTESKPAFRVLFPNRVYPFCMIFRKEALADSIQSVDVFLSSVETRGGSEPSRVEFGPITLSPEKFPFDPFQKSQCTLSQPDEN